MAGLFAALGPAAAAAPEAAAAAPAAGAAVPAAGASGAAAPTGLQGFLQMAGQGAHSNAPAPSQQLQAVHPVLGQQQQLPQVDLLQLIQQLSNRRQ